MDIAVAPSPSAVRTVSSALTVANRWDHFLARWAFMRSGHRVEPGLYAVGRPGADAPVFVTANYTLSFDALRAALAGVDGHILVLDTEGVNVWCAAGKGTFGTEELVHRIEASGLSAAVKHRVLILPQLGAPGVAAHEVKQRTGFKVEYGPVRAADLPEYLRARKAAPEMRQARFSISDRLVLIPVELVAVLLPLLIVAVATFLLGGLLTAAAAVSAMLAGVAVFPLLLPWLPTRDFSTKGFVLGIAVVLPFALARLLGHPDEAGWLRAAQALSLMLALAPVTAFLALNFTGSTTFTSRSGVKREIYRYVPPMAVMFGAGLLLAVAARLIR